MQDLESFKKKINSTFDENKWRRTILVTKCNRKKNFGFTIQTYGIKKNNKASKTDDDKIYMITYIDYVEYESPAYYSGLNKGDVILSINGMSMEETTHEELVKYIKSQNVLRMVVLFEDCSGKIELYLRYFKLKEIMLAKINEFRLLESRELELLDRPNVSSPNHDLRRPNSTSNDFTSVAEVVEAGVGADKFLHPHYTTSLVEHQINSKSIMPHHYFDSEYRCNHDINSSLKLLNTTSPPATPSCSSHLSNISTPSVYYHQPPAGLNPKPEECKRATRAKCKFKNTRSASQLSSNNNKSVDYPDCLMGRQVFHLKRHSSNSKLSTVQEPKTSLTLHKSTYLCVPNLRVLDTIAAPISTTPTSKNKKNKSLDLTPKSTGKLVGLLTRKSIPTPCPSSRRSEMDKGNDDSFVNSVAKLTTPFRSRNCRSFTAFASNFLNLAGATSHDATPLPVTNGGKKQQLTMTSPIQQHRGDRIDISVTPSILKKYPSNHRQQPGSSIQDSFSHKTLRFTKSTTDVSKEECIVPTYLQQYETYCASTNGVESLGLVERQDDVESDPGSDFIEFKANTESDSSFFQEVLSDAFGKAFVTLKNKFNCTNSAHPTDMIYESNSFNPIGCSCDRFEAIPCCLGNGNMGYPSSMNHAPSLSYSSSESCIYLNEDVLPNSEKTIVQTNQQITFDGSQPDLNKKNSVMNFSLLECTRL